MADRRFGLLWAPKTGPFPVTERGQYARPNPHPSQPPTAADFLHSQGIRSHADGLQTGEVDSAYTAPQFAPHSFPPYVPSVVHSIIFQASTWSSSASEPGDGIPAAERQVSIVADFPTKGLCDASRRKPGTRPSSAVGCCDCARGRARPCQVVGLRSCLAVVCPVV